VNNVKGIGKSVYSATSVKSDEPFIEMAWLSTPDGHEVQQLKTGDSLVFNIKVANANRGLSLNFSLCNAMGYKITNFNTLNTSDSDVKSETGLFSCIVEELLLSEGTYIVNIALVHGGELIDHKTDAIIFDVCSAPLRGRKIGNRNYGTNILMHHCWKIPAYK
jgi:hypothetical protein